MRLLDWHHAPEFTQPCELRDYPEWHRGRKRYCLWSIPVECPKVLSRLEAARTLLGDWLQPSGIRQAHVTLFVCGFVCAVPRHDDDIATAVLDDQRAAIETLQLAPFTLRIGGLDSFASAAFMAVEENDTLSCLRQELGRLSTEVRQAPYVPHLTVGLYRMAASTAEWRSRAAALRDCLPLDLPVHELQLVSYAATEPVGALRVEARVALA